MIQYLQIFNSNGYNTHDTRLLQLSEQMGGTPVSIKQDREHWAEIGALLYLRERLPELSKRSKLPTPVKQAIDEFYSAYPGRFQTTNQ
jgi:hypothetical protein